MDGLDHWSAILGDATSPRNELVLNLPRSKTWTLGEDKTEEGVALRVGSYKLLINHCFDFWFSPNAGPDHVTANHMMASDCKYDWYDTEEVRQVP